MLRTSAPLIGALGGIFEVIVMWTMFDMNECHQQVSHAIQRRIRGHPLALEADVLRFPVAFLFVRGDRGGEGEQIANQVVRSFGHWNDDSGQFFDIVIPGWGKDGDQVVYDRSFFFHCREQLEGICKWRYGGETELLLLNYEAKRTDNVRFGPVTPSFESCIVIPIEELIRNRQVAHIDKFMHQLVALAKECWTDSDQEGVWQISDRIAFHHGQKKIWEKLMKWLDVTGLFKELKPFAVCDLRSQ